MQTTTRRFILAACVVTLVAAAYGTYYWNSGKVLTRQCARRLMEIELQINPPVEPVDFYVGETVHCPENEADFNRRAAVYGALASAGIVSVRRGDHVDIQLTDKGKKLVANEPQDWSDTHFCEADRTSLFVGKPIRIRIEGIHLENSTTAEIQVAWDWGPSEPRYWALASGGGSATWRALRFDDGWRIIPK